MSRHSLALPLGLVAAMVVLLSLLPIWSSPGSQAAPLLACDPGSPSEYPVPCQTQTAAAGGTQTAVGSVGTATATSGTATATGTARTATNTTATVTGTPPTAIPTLQITATFAPSETRGPTVVLPTATPVNGAVTCIPGTTLEIKGQGPRRTPLLLYFNGRAVGGGVSDATGNYRLTITIGPERAAFYPVEVRVRGTRQLVRELTCLVPYFTPTPTRRPRTPSN
ncbi:MAG: hypothetical protein H7Y32_07005 [Chloroflexales bacterium]|nr:hypothetical protein [Chloroflexales bacterium]